MQRTLWMPSYSKEPPSASELMTSSAPQQRVELELFRGPDSSWDSSPPLFSCHPQPPERQDKRECFCFSFLL